MLRQDFLFKLSLDAKNEYYYQQIKNADISVAVHVRRGDYIGIGHALDIKYYERAMNYLVNKYYPYQPVFFVFSNGMQWVREHFPLHAKLVFVETNDESAGALDMFLMANCQHQIIANSTFSWWAAWLNRNAGKNVIAPNQWFGKNVEDGSVMPNSWVKIPCN